MSRLILWAAEFVTDPLNILIFLFLWVGVALLETAAPLDVKAMIVLLMAGPAGLGYMIGRRK
jgi:hypothetical protein